MGKIKDALLGVDGALQRNPKKNISLAGVLALVVGYFVGADPATIEGCLKLLPVMQ